MRRLYLTTCFLTVCCCAQAQFQGLIINEVAPDYIELLVVGKKTCTDSTANLRGWILDDHNGWFGVDALGSHADRGHLRLSFASLHWGEVPFGSIILIYDEKSKNPKIPGDDYIDVNKDNLYVLPATVHLDEDNAVPDVGTTSFGAYSSNYVAGSQTNWSVVKLDAAADAFIIVDPAYPDKPHFAIAWGGLSNGLRATLGKAGGIFKPNVSLSSGSCHLINSVYSDDKSYTYTANQTPGFGNSPANQAWIDAMRASLKPYLSITDPGVCAPALVDLTQPSVTLNSGVDLTLSFWKDAAAVVPINNPAAVDAGIYYIKAVNAHGCWDIKPVQAFVSNQPPPPIVTVIDNCDGTSLLTATGIANGADVSWNNGETTPKFLTNASASFSAIQSVNGCASSSSQSVKSSPRRSPTIQVNAPATVCGATGYINVTTSSGMVPYSYALNDNTPGANSSFNNLSSGNYTVTVVDAAGCKTEKTVIISNNSVSANATAKQNLCESQGSIAINVTSGVQPYSFSLNGSAFTTTSIFQNLAAGNYSVTVKDNTGCYTILQTDLNINRLLTTVVASPVPCGQTGSITVSVQNGLPPFTYSLDDVNFSSNNTFTGLKPGSYTCTVRDVNGCDYPNGVVLQALASTMQVQASTTVDACKQVAIINATASSGISPYTYSLDGVNYQNAGSFSITSSGNFSVQVKDAAGCTVPPKQVSVAIPAPFQIDLSATKTKLQWGEPVKLQLNSFQSFEVIGWYPTGVFGNSSLPYQQFKADTSLTITVIAKSSYGCLDTVSISLEVAPLNDIYIPSAFTPNWDGNNDVFRVIAPKLKSSELKIYNRWGELVFLSTDIRHGWDGMYKGKLQSSGVFVYYLTVTNANGTTISHKGTVTLIR